MHIGIVGLGIMGFKAAVTLRERGYTVQGYDVFPRAAERASKEGITLAVSPADLAAVSDFVLLFVPGPKETEEVIAGENGIASRAGEGLLVINMSTVDPDVNIRMGKLLGEKGAGLVDAPVLGSPSGVGNWAFPVGGDPKHVEAATPVLVALGGAKEKIYHVGALGNGNQLKLLNNMMLGAINACAAEIMALAHHMGLSQKTLIDVAVAANARTLSNIYREIGERVAESRYDKPTFTVDMLVKDNHLCLEMARKQNLPLVVASAVDNLNRMASRHGLGREDTASAWKMVAASWGHTL